MKQYKVFNLIFESANKLREATINQTITDILKSYDIYGNDPHNITKSGEVFERSFDSFMSNKYNIISKELFTSKLYEALLERGFSEWQALNFIYYYFKPAIKRYPIPETYQKVEYYYTTTKDNTYKKSIPIPRSKGLYIYLVDIIENYLHAKDFLLSSEFDKRLSEIMSQGEVLNTITDNDLIKKIKNIKDEDPKF